MTTKTCYNCLHSSSNDKFAHCVLVGTFCSTEMIFGGRCAGPKTGVPQMNLWELRPEKKTWFARIFEKKP